MSDKKLENVIPLFFDYVIENNIELYNEFSFQHELGIFLRNELANYKVQFERNISFFYDDLLYTGKKTVKHEIDISIFNNDKTEKYAIELKYPLNGQTPEQMYAFVKDIKFMEQVKTLGFNNTYCIMLIDARQVLQGTRTDGIYKYFRVENKIYGRIYKPTGGTKHTDCIEVEQEHLLDWRKFNDRESYCCVKI